MSAEGGTKAIIAALSANAGIAVAKFAGFAVTGSSSMLSEGVHSLADTANQGLLLLGRKAADREADAEHPFGYGRNRYFYAFVVALLLFSLGALFAIYEGVEKIAEPHELESPLVAVIILVVALALEGYSFTTAMRETAKVRGGRGWWRFITTAKDPDLPVVLLEDSGALLGLVFALAGVGLSVLTGDPVWDGIGTLAIGALLAVIAIVLIVEMKSLLIGEGVDRALYRTIVAELESGAVRTVIHLRTEYLAPDELLVAAKIALHGEPGMAEVAAAIDDAEARLRERVPTARWIYLEPDLLRTELSGSPRKTPEDG
ncbi:cation diffusion facilitator family transporter [Sciscionella marina]|uniref:cation diffusion facilitator family transporter n=1 Tax=Sciscionella marina TaxID=508770 RepID=UPI00037327FA|nr:cation diffusion facilitator family transporter [Sciscionella marina]